MLEHIVLFKIRSTATEEQKSLLIRNLLSLKDKISGISWATAGANVSARSKGFNLGFIARFNDAAALAAYLPHPAHQAVVEAYVKPIAEDVLVVDYEFD